MEKTAMIDFFHKSLSGWLMFCEVGRVKSLRHFFTAILKYNPNVSKTAHLAQD